jgi:hypothetical protein
MNLMDPLDGGIKPCRKAATYTRQHKTQQKREVGFELTIKIFDRAKTFHALETERPLWSAHI